MKISKVKFLTSSSSFKETKKIEPKPEYAFIEDQMLENHH